MYRTRSHPVQLTVEDRRAVIQHVLTTIPAQGRTHSGVIAGVACVTSQSQRDAIHRGYRTALAQKRRTEAAA